MYAWLSEVLLCFVHFVCVCVRMRVCVCGDACYMYLKCGITYNVMWHYVHESESIVYYLYVSEYV